MKKAFCDRCGREVTQVSIETYTENLPAQRIHVRHMFSQSLESYANGWNETFDIDLCKTCVAQLLTHAADKLLGKERSYV